MWNSNGKSSFRSHLNHLDTCGIMDAYKQRPDFAEMQIRNLLKEMNGKNHGNKVGPPAA